MKIGMILKKFDPVTGKSRHLLEVSRRLVARGHVVHLVTNRVEWNGERAELQHLSITEISGSQNALYLKPKKVMQILESKGVDVIELHGGMSMSLFAKRFARIASRPLILNIHSQPTDFLHELSYLSWSDWKHDHAYIADIDDALGFFMRILGYHRFWKHPNIRAVIVPNRALEHQYRDRAPVTFIPSGADIHAYQKSLSAHDEARAILGYAPTDSVVLFYGRAVMVRGMDTIIQACELLAPTHPRLRLVMFLLEDVDLQRTLKRVEQSPARQQITLKVGRNPQMPTVLQAADVCVFPFRTTGCIPEQPLTLVEAMASEKTVVTTAIGSIPEIVQDGVNGRIVPPNNAVALSKVLAELLCDPEMRERLSRNARETIEKDYHWDVITDQTLQLYERVTRSTSS